MAALIALLVIAAVSSLAAGQPPDASRALGGAIARRITCAPRLPDACRHHPLVRAYGWPLARLVRALAPAPTARPGPAGLPLVPVDFRYCRRPSCAVPRPEAESLHLTESGRTVDYLDYEAYEGMAEQMMAKLAADLKDRYDIHDVAIHHRVGRVEIGQPSVVIAVSAAHRHDAPVGRVCGAGTGAHPLGRALAHHNPALVPLETVPGRNQYRFPRGERPPWQWRLDGIYPG